MDFWNSPDGRFLWYLITEEEDCIEKVTCPEIGQDPCFKKVDCEQVLTLDMIITDYFIGLGFNHLWGGGAGLVSFPQIPNPRALESGLVDRTPWLKIAL